MDILDFLKNLQEWVKILMGFSVILFIALAIFINNFRKTRSIWGRALTQADKIKNLADLPKSSQKHFEKEIKMLREHLHKQYTSLLKQKLGNDLVIPLLIEPKGENRDQITNDKLLILLEKYHSFLILGNPGAGKTTLVYQIAKKRLEDDTKEFIPVVFNIASWEKYIKTDTPKLADFEDWMISVLMDTTNISDKNYAQILIGIGNDTSIKDKKPILIPIFDGFDELALKENETKKTEIRKRFLLCHNNFKSKYRCKYSILTSRINDMKGFHGLIHNSINKIDLIPFTKEYLINQLTLLKIDSDDANKSTSRYRLLEMIRNEDEHSPLIEVLTNPFFFHITCKLINDIELAVTPKSSIADYEHSLLSEYVQRGFAELERQGFQKDKLEGYMRMLSYVLLDNNAVTFELTDIFQIKYIKGKKQLYLTVFGFSAFLIIGYVRVLARKII